MNKYKVLLCHCSFNHINVTNDFSEKCFSITCVRNPINRILSHYYFFDYPNTKVIFNKLKIDEIINYIKSYGNVILARLSGWTYNIDDAIENLKKINCILIFEKFEKDLILLNNTLNIKYNKNIKINNCNKNINHNLYKNYEDIQIINQYTDYIIDLKIYEIIINMTDDERFKN